MAAPARRRFTVAEYHRMAETGILRPDDRVELLEGEIIEMAPIGSRHGAYVDRLNRAFVLRAGDRAIVRVQGAVRLGDVAEPEPDLALLAPRGDFYEGAQPGPADVLLVVEVSDASLAYDRDVKVPVYARYGVREVWVVDVQSREVMVFGALAGETYGDRRVARRGETLEPAALPGVVVAVDEITGRADPSP